MIDDVYTVEEEDQNAILSVKKGIQSQAFKKIYLFSKEEKGILHFHKYISKKLATSF